MAADPPCETDLDDRVAWMAVGSLAGHIRIRTTQRAASVPKIAEMDDDPEGRHKVRTLRDIAMRVRFRSQRV